MSFYIYFLKILRRNPVKEAGIIFQNLPNVRSCATYTDIFATLMSLRNILANFQPFTACNGLVHHKTHEFNFSLVRADAKLTVVEVELIFFVASNATTTICSNLYLLRICIEFAFDIA